MKDISKPKRVTKATTNDDPIIYLEADEEITAATSRMLASSSKEVRIVVPKRSTLLQSVVNQKLLKRAADNAGKSLILVTADRTASHLAAQVGLPVASSVKAEAAVPEATEAPQEDNSDIIETAAEAAAVATVAKAAASPKPAYATPMMKSEPKVNNPFAPSKEATQAPTPVTSAKPGKAPKPAKTKKSRNVPDFNSLPKKVLIGVGAALAVILLMFAQYYFKKADVTLFAAGQLVDVNTNFKVDTNADSVSITSATLPGRKYEVSKEVSDSTPTTGTKDAGTKASGTMTINNCFDSSPRTFVAGTRLQAASGEVFLTATDVTVPGGNVNVFGCSSPGKATVTVTASQNGDTYNKASGTRYTIPGVPSAQQQYIYGVGSQMSGGTTKNIKVVSQADIDKAKTQAMDKSKDDATKELEDKVTSSQMILPDSFTATPTTVTASPELNAEGDQVTVKVNVTYSIMTIKKDDLEAYVTAIEKKQVGSDKQIYQSGVDDGKITAVNGAYNFTSTASAGQKIDTDALLQEIKGKKTGAATDIASKVPGVSRVDIHLTPSWSVKLPSIVDHIKIEIKVEEQSKP